MSKKLKIIFTLSLLLNVLLVGFIAGRLTSYDFKRHHEQRQAVLKQFPDDKRAMVEEAFKAHRKDMRKHFKARHDVRKEMGKILREEPFDEAAFMALSQKMQRDSQQMRQAMQDKIVTLAKQLNQDERALLVEMLRKPRHFRHGGRGHFGGERFRERFMRDDAPPPPHDAPRHAVE